MLSKNARFGRSTDCKMIKIVILFLLLLVAVSMIGTLFRPGGFLSFLRPPPPIAQTKAKCASCGRTVVGTAPCVCGKG